jgi:hypothetical protein
MAKKTRVKNNKWEYLYVLQGDYGYGWEDLTASDDRREIRNDLKDYRENERGHYRVISRRVLNTKNRGMR